MASRTHSDGLEIDISSGDLKETGRGWSGKRGPSGRSVGKARLEGGPEDGELDEGHILQSPRGGGKLGEEEEA